ncbi:MAG: M28 family metallopeptidase [Candidatus Kariarchaeaceae archaeon]|jgi:hypothetical protein
MSTVTLENVESTWELTRKLTEECYPRLTGTLGCKNAGELIKGTLEVSCDRVKTQEFNHRPRGFLKFMPWSGFIHFIALVLLFLDYTLIALGLFILNAFIFVSQLLFYWGLFDFPFKEETGTNVIGTIEPSSEVKQQIILSGHYDAPYVFQLLDRTPKWYPRIFSIALFSVILGFVGTLIIYFVDSGLPIFRIILTILSVTVISFFIFTTNQVSPGAGDNAIAVGLIAEMAVIFSQDRLENTRLIISALDAEEAGLNGARAYVNKYREEFKIPTFNFNIDSIYDKEFLQIFTRDLNYMRKLSMDEALIVQGISKELGHELPLGAMPVGGGSTDSAEFARVGVDSIALVGIDLKTLGQKTAYHSSRDDMSALSKESVKFVLELLELYCKRKDSTVN